MTSPQSPPPTTDRPRRVEVAIVGGGPAGLSAALVLGRARRSVVVVDAGAPAHFVADAVHGFLGQENVPPRELRRRVWEQLEPFDVELVQDEVVDGRAVGAGGADALGGPLPGAAAGGGRLGARPVATGFELTLAGGTRVVASTVLLAGGLHYGVRDVPGLAELWGSRLFHCPFCHGWEVAGKRVAVLAPPAFVGHLQGMLALWAGETVGFSIGEPAEPAEGHGAAEAVAVAVGVRLDGDEVVIEAADGALTRVDAIFAPPLLGPVGELAGRLGLRHEVETPLADEPVGLRVDAQGATSVPGVFAAGDLAGDQPAVAMAVQSGMKAAVGIVRTFAGQA